ncbi:Ig-like domain-containing protein [Pantoea dispersa]|uniref:Ig-like domain-containing protein n=1 Tax=Pantoea dispersa TaxID=59814 RepID=UPI00123B73D2|nr:Ig-like domain-containing protein [Pantoea dispersa]KAA8673202.1 hypothetical protein F4W08_04480 [Pantoea dispersa]
MEILDYKEVIIHERTTANPTFSGSANTEIGLGGTMRIVIGDTEYRVDINPETGRWSWTAPEALKDGEYSVFFQTIDKAGNPSPPTLITLVVDTTPPAAPKLLFIYDDQGNETGIVNPGETTDDRRPTLTGFAQKNTLVYLKDGGTIIGSAKTDENGVWVIEPEKDLSNGDHKLTLVAKETFNKTERLGAESEVIDLKIGTISKSTQFETGKAITQPANIISNEESATLSDKVVKTVQYLERDTATPTFQGNSPSEKGRGGSMIITIGKVTYTTEIDKEGNWSFTPPQSFADGEYSLAFQSVDKAGNISLPSLFTLKVDTTPPVAPKLLLMYDDQGSQIGMIENGGISDDKVPTLTGVAQKNTIVYLKDSGKIIGSALADQDGIWTIEPEVALTDGIHKLTLIAKETFNKKERWGEESTDFTLTVDTTAPDKPVITGVSDDAGAIQGPVAKDGVTDDKRPALSGTAEKNSTVTIYIDNVPRGSVIADGNGKWTFTPGTDLADGKHQFHIIATDAAGNASAQSDSWGITVDTKMPVAPTIESILDDAGSVTGSVKNGGITDDKTPTLHGKGVPGTIIEVQFCAAGKTWQAAGTATVDENGNWTLTPPALSADGAWEYQARAFNGANHSPWSSKFVLNVSTEADKAPEITHAVDDAGAVQGNLKNGDITDDRTPTLHGKGVPGAVIAVQYNKAGTSGWIDAGSAVVDASGNWHFTSPDLKTDGTVHFIARSVNGAKVSDRTGYFTVKVYASADKAPEITHAVDNSGAVQGDVKHGGITDDKTPTLHGKGVPGAVIEVKYSKAGGEWVVAGSAVVDASGNWHLTSPDLKTDGSVSFAARSINGAKMSDWSNTFTLKVYATADAVPEITHVMDDAGAVTGPVKSNEYTDDKTPVLHGKGVPGAIIEVQFGLSTGSWQAAGSAVVDASGNWRLESPALTTDGRYEYRARSTNGVKQSAWTGKFYLNLDTAAPDKPVITGVNDDAGAIQGPVAKDGVTDDKRPALSGTAERDSVVTVYIDNVPRGSVIADGNGKWTFTPGTDLADGKHQFHIIATDAAGNASAKSDSWAITVDTVAPGKPAITDVRDDVGAVTGSIGKDGVTDDRRPTLSGTAERDSVVTVYIDNVPRGSVIADGNGKWTFTPGTDLSDGKHQFHIIATDDAGNSSGKSDSWDIEVDTTIAAPVIKGIRDDIGSIRGDLNSGDYTDDNRPELWGTAKADSIVTIFDGAIIIGSVKANASGEWSFIPPRELADGTHTFTAQAKDQTGNTSGSSNSWSIIVDTIPPDAPDIDFELSSTSLLMLNGEETNVTEFNVGSDPTTVTSINKQLPSAELLVAANEELFSQQSEIQHQSITLKLEDIVKSENINQWGQETEEASKNSNGYQVFIHSVSGEETLIQDKAINNIE